MLYDSKQFSFCHDQQPSTRDNFSKIEAVKAVRDNTFFDTSPSVQSSAVSRDDRSNVAKKKPYQCEYCDKSFSKPSALQPHIYTHTGEKPYQCHIPGCSKRFAVISNLRRHFKVHGPKNTSKSRMSYKERILRVRQLATLAKLDQQLDSSKLDTCTEFDIPESNVPQSVDMVWKVGNDMPNYSFEPTTFIGTQILTDALEQPHPFPSTTLSFNDCTTITDMYLTFDNPSNTNDVESVPGWVRC